MTKYLCQKGRGMVTVEGDADVDTFHMAKVKMGCHQDCKHSIERYKSNPKVYNLMQFSDRVCHGPSKCASK